MNAQKLFEQKGLMLSNSKVACIKTSPETVHGDYIRLLELAGSTEALDSTKETFTAIDMSWHNHSPACSSSPWQLDGVIGALIDSGISAGSVRALLNESAGIHKHFGEILNRFQLAAKKHDVVISHPGSDTQRTAFTPKNATPTLSKALNNSISLPEGLAGANLVLLPTMKTHSALSIAGATYTAFNTLFGKERHRALGSFDDALLETLAITKDACPGTFAVMDASFSGDGAGPRRLMPRETGFILASADPLALDAVAATMMGFDPLSISWIAQAHALKLGCGDPSLIEIVGDSWEGHELSYSAQSSALESVLWKLESSGSPLLNRLAVLFDDLFWYVPVAEKRMKPFKKSGWFKLFESYRKSG